MEVCLIVTDHFSEYCSLYFRVSFVWVFFLSCGCMLFRKVSAMCSRVGFVFFGGGGLGDFFGGCVLCFFFFFFNPFQELDSPSKRIQMCTV